MSSANFNNFSKEFIELCELEPVKDKPRSFIRRDGEMREQKIAGRIVPVYSQGTAILQGSFTIYDPFKREDITVAIAPRLVNQEGIQTWTHQNIEFNGNAKIIISTGDAKSNNMLYALTLHPQNLDNPLRSEKARELGISIPDIDYGKAYFSEEKDSVNVSEALKLDKLMTKCLQLIEISDEETKRELVRSNSDIAKVVDADGDIKMIEAGLNHFAKTKPDYFYTAWNAENIMLKSKLNAWIKADLLVNTKDQWFNSYDNTMVCVVGVGEEANESLLKFFSNSKDSGTIQNKLIKDYDKLTAIEKQAK